MLHDKSWIHFIDLSLAHTCRNHGEGREGGLGGEVLHGAPLNFQEFALSLTMYIHIRFLPRYRAAPPLIKPCSYNYVALTPISSN